MRLQRRPTWAVLVCAILARTLDVTLVFIPRLVFCSTCDGFSATVGEIVLWLTMRVISCFSFMIASGSSVILLHMLKGSKHVRPTQHLRS